MQHEFVDLAERFRHESDLEEAKRLGDQLGRMIFGSREDSHSRSMDPGELD